MLFTLRLLPITKVAPRRVIYVAFFLNFAITVIATVSYGVRCVPFTAIYDPGPNARCIPTNVIIATQQVNGGESESPEPPSLVEWEGMRRHKI